MTNSLIHWTEILYMLPLLPSDIPNKNQDRETVFAALKADISAGAVGSPNGYTTLIVRTLVGQHLLESAVASGKLSTTDELNLGIVEKLGTKKLERKQK